MVKIHSDFNEFSIVHYPLKAMQELIIFLIFAAALGYMGFRMYRSFFSKQTGCGKGCGCATDSKTTQLH